MNKTLLDIVRCYYSHNHAGGSLHIVLDDGNIEDHDIKYCIEWAQKSKDLAGELLGVMLLNCSEQERKELYEADKFPEWKRNYEEKTKMGT